MRFGLNLPPQIRVYVAFFFYSLALGGIFPRLGDLQLAMGVGEGALGMALIGTGLGTFVSLTFASPLLDRFGYRRTLMIGTILLAAIMALATFSTGPLMLFCILLCAGLAIGAIEVVLNVEADRTEHLVGYRIMNRCHAFWSLGFFSAGIIGAAAKQAEISPQAHLIAMAVFTAIAIPLALSRMAPAAARSANSEEQAPKFTMPSLGILTLVAFTLAGVLLEGAGSDWSVIYMRDSFDALPFVNGLAIAIGALAQSITRFFADGFVERFGPERISRFLVLTMGTGLLVVVWAQHPFIALFGFALMGVGTSAVFPLAMSAAAQRTDRPAALNVASLAQLSFVAFLVGPPILGFVAEHFGMRVAFGVCLPFVVLSWFSIKSLRVPEAAQANG